MGERVRDSLHISERMWQDKVEHLAILNGWLVDHKTPMRYASGHVRTTGLPGMPDLTLIHPAGHGFNCEQRADYHEPSAQAALQRTLAFFTRTLR